MPKQPLPFEGFAVDSSRCCWTGVLDLYRGNAYLASYRTAQDLLLDITFKWKAWALPDLMTKSLSLPRVPKFRAEIWREFIPISFEEIMVSYADQLNPIIDFLAEQQQFCMKASRHFEMDSASIERFDPETRSFVAMADGLHRFKSVTDMLMALRRSPALTAEPLLQGVLLDLNFDVFISHKSADYALAKQVSDYLKEQQLRVFLAEESLPHIGSADYMKEIDGALEHAKHLVVVASTKENLESPWVEAEWRLFINEKRAGRKPGNVVTVAASSLQPNDIPMSLRYYEVIALEQPNLGRLLQYLREPKA